MAQWVKVLATKPENLSLVPRDHVMGISSHKLPSNLYPCCSSIRPTPPPLTLVTLLLLSRDTMTKAALLAYNCRGLVRDHHGRKRTDMMEEQ